MEEHNKLDGLIFSVEQTLKESGDKLTDSDKTELNSAVEEAKKALESDDEEAYKAAFETLSNKVQPIFAKLYSQSQQGAQGAGGAVHNIARRL